MLCKFSVLFLYVSVSQPTLSTSRSAQELGQRNPTLLRTSQTDWLRTLIGGPPSFSSFSLFLLLHLPSFLPSSSSSSSSLTFPCDFWLFGSFSICHTLSQRFSLAFLLVLFFSSKNLTACVWWRERDFWVSDTFALRKEKKKAERNWSCGSFRNGHYTQARASSDTPATSSCSLAFPPYKKTRSRSLL